MRRSLYAYWCWTPWTFRQWDSNEQRWVNDFSHKLHLYGRTPVCVLVCLFKSNVSLNPLPQNVHKYRLISEWHFMCRFKSRCSVKCFEQMRQTNLPSSSDGTLQIISSGWEIVACFFSGTCSSSRKRPWMFSIASGFLIPCPPLTNSNWTSAGKPN